MNDWYEKPKPKPFLGGKFLSVFKNALITGAISSIVSVFMIVTTGYILENVFNRPSQFFIFGINVEIQALLLLSFIVIAYGLIFYTPLIMTFGYFGIATIKKLPAKISLLSYVILGAIIGILGNGIGIYILNSYSLGLLFGLREILLAIFVGNVAIFIFNKLMNKPVKGIQNV